ncbi:MAG: leucine-rich repeat protein [Lachnospiraceae bacterium]|nr:leucine-rich repeat protein [Lachnospiraceae bacterium]
MKKKKVQKLLSAAMMVSICVTMGAMPVSAASMDTGVNQEDILTVGATTIENNSETSGIITDANQSTIEWTYNNGTLTFTGKDASQSTPNQNLEIEIPEKVIDKIVNTQTTSGSAITWEKDNVENLKINGTVTSIASKAFADCTKLKEATISGDVTTIGKKAFIDCKNLETVKFNSSLEEIGVQAFANCEKLTNVELPDTLKTIGDQAFFRCYKLKKIEIPASLTTIGRGVFVGAADCLDKDENGEIAIIKGKEAEAHKSNMKNVTPPTSDSVLAIDANGLVFNKDKTILYCALKHQDTLILPESLTEVQDYAFDGCVANVIRFTGKKPNFGSHAFDMPKLPEEADDIYYKLKATVYYPGDDESWKGIEKENFGGDITWKPYEKNAIEDVYEGCKWVYNLDSKTFTISSNDGKPVEIPDFESYEDTPWAQEAKEEIEKKCKTIIIADDITRVGNASFGKLFAQVENITFSQNLKSIGKDAFVACGAGTKKAPQFTLPDSLETIEDGAFASLEGFTELTIPKGVKDLASTAFLGCNKLKTIKVAEDNENLCAIDDVVYDKKVTTLVLCSPTKEKVEMPQSISRVAAKSFVGCESLKEIKFTGNAPTFEDNCFILSETDKKTTPLKITAYYPSGNSTWTEDKLKDYGGKVKWEAYNVGTEPGSGSDSSNHVVYHYDLETHGGTWDGTHYYLPNGTLVTDAFFCDGTYTYYLQFDGTPMKGRLAYHPDGRHVIYFDDEGHEVFNTFANVKQDVKGNPVDDLCYFNVYGFMYVNVLTYDQAGKNLYYANMNGVMERNGWFKFPENNIGYANADGTLVVSQFSKDTMGRTVYFQANGKLAKGLITDGVTYYKMDETDGHLVGTFVK